jgi:hypothetical protein
MQIRHIVLYSLKGAARVVTFNLGGLSIVTGRSKTGKSALLDVVDYCLGRDSCHVPPGPIRDKVSWYGLLLNIGESELFIARKPPARGERQDTTVFVKSGALLDVPPFAELMPNSNTDSLQRQLDAILGITPNLNLSKYATNEGFQVNVRHTTFFTFQEQGEIATKKILFHRQAEEFIPPAIRQTLPYFLGAIPEDRLLRLNELQRTREELLSLQQALAEGERVSGGGQRALELALEARDLNLLNFDTPPSDRDALDDMLAVALQQRDEETQVISDEPVSRLRSARRELLRKYRDLTDEIKAAETFNREQMGFLREGERQTARLHSIRLFRDGDGTKCPLCESPATENQPGVASINAALQELSQRLSSIPTEAAQLATHLDNLHKQAGQLREDLATNLDRLTAVAIEQQAIGEQEEAIQRRAYVRGRISLYVQTRGPRGDIAALKRQVADLRDKVTQLESELDVNAIRDRLSSILNANRRTHDRMGEGTATRVCRASTSH